MRQAVIEHTRKMKGERKKIFMLPHAYNYMLKEEIIRSKNEINDERVYMIKKIVGKDMCCPKSIVVAEKIIKGV